jgi:hypothetical protein
MLHWVRTIASSSPNEQSPNYASSISVDQTATEGLSEADEATALASQSRISRNEDKFFENR